MSVNHSNILISLILPELAFLLILCFSPLNKKKACSLGLGCPFQEREPLPRLSFCVLSGEHVDSA